MGATTVQHKWGNAIVMENNNLYCGKILKFRAGYRTSLQYHKNKDETLYVYSGCVIVEHEIDNIIISETMNPGEVIRIRPFTKHRITALLNSDIIETSTHHEDSDTIQLEPGGSIPK